MADAMVVMHRTHLMAVVMTRLGLGHARAQAGDERQGGDGGFHDLLQHKGSS
jgi:hypothetical protein